MKTINGVINLIIGGFLGYLIAFAAMAIIAVECEIGFDIQISEYIILVITRIGTLIGGSISYKKEWFNVL